MSTNSWLSDSRVPGSTCGRSPTGCSAHWARRTTPSRKPG